MKRRDFITLLGEAVAAWPLHARAQQAVGFRRIGVLMSLAHDDRQGRRYIAAFLDRLQELGWKDGPGLAIDVRWGAADLDHIRNYASELAAVKPNVILAQSALALTPIQRVTETIPIVFVQVFRATACLLCMPIPISCPMAAWFHTASILPVNFAKRRSMSIAS
jgi:putative tryptophan/tyrosine transport system substrate-binding protein